MTEFDIGEPKTKPTNGRFLMGGLKFTFPIPMTTKEILVSTPKGRFVFELLPENILAINEAIA
jgi:hypothetical protein